MKKGWKRIAAAISAAAIAATGFIGATTANADPVGTGTITLNGTVAQDQYQGYRLLDVTGVNGTSVAYAVNSKYSTVLKTALKLDQNATDKQIVDGINALNTTNVTGAGTTSTNGGDVTAVRAFASTVFTQITNANIQPDVSKTATGTTLAFTDIPRGYYLFNQNTNGKPDTNTDSSFIVNSALEGNLTIQVKNGTVTLTKKVQDNDTSNGQAAGSWNDSADWNIGDSVPFQLTGTTPANINSFDSFTYIFHDTMSKGLTFVKQGATVASSDVVVQINGTTVPATQYTVNLSPVAANITGTYEGGNELTVSFTNLLNVNDADGKVIALNGDDTVTVNYSAILNENANIGGAGNPNEANLEFSNNSNHNGTGDTTTTPNDKVTVFTYQLDVEKTFDVGTPNDNDLPKFTLQKKNAEGVYVDYTNSVELNAEKTVVKGTDGKYTINWKGLDAGEYQLTETHTPAGYQTATPVEFTITANHELNSDDPQLKALTTNNTNVTGDAATGSVSTTIANISGSALPSTGGMGTTIMYIVGGVIVLLAGIGLAVALRRRQA